MFMITVRTSVIYIIRVRLRIIFKTRVMVIVRIKFEVITRERVLVKVNGSITIFCYCKGTDEGYCQNKGYYYFDNNCYDYFRIRVRVTVRLDIYFGI